MFDAIPNLFLEFNIDQVTFLKFLDRLQAFTEAHDAAVPERHLDAGQATVDQELEVLAPVPVVVGRMNRGFQHLMFIILYFYI